MNEDKTIRAGILGLGMAGNMIVRSMARTPGVQIAAAADLREHALAAFRDEFGGRMHGSIERLVDDPGVDAVWIASPSHLHAQHAIMAMNAGDADRPGLGVQPVVERRADGQDPAAGTVARLEDDHRASRPSKEIGCAQAGEAGADDDHRVAGVGRARLGESLQQRWRGGSRQGGELEKPSACDVSPHGERSGRVILQPI